jgi:hypothetical protein
MTMLKGLALIAFAERITPALKVRHDLIAFDEHVPVFVFLEQGIFLLVEGL